MQNAKDATAPCYLSDIVAALGGLLVLAGAPENDAAAIAVAQIAPLENAPAGSISFITRAQFLQHLPSCHASALIVSEKLADAPALQRFNRIITADAYHYYALLSQWWKKRHTPQPENQGIHSSAVVHSSASIHPSVSIGPLCVVEAGAKIGAGTRLASRVTVGYDCEIGDNCLLHAGVVIGADGFGFAQHAGAWEKIEQLGRVLIGNTDIRDIPKETLMNKVSFVFQNSRLIKASILENVRMAKPDATREEIAHALEAAQCLDIIEKLPNGIDTVVGAKGVYLSGGEQQRIAIARAILKNAPIIILDEATAFADPDNEVRVQQALSALSKGKTVIMIAHRLSSITDADCIYVLQDGEIVESGTHSGLIERNGIFTKMWKDYSEAAEWKIAKEVNA